LALGSIQTTIIAYALKARQIAEDAKSGNDQIRREKQQRRDRLLELAEQADNLASHFREAESFSGIAGIWSLQLKLPVLPEQEVVIRIEPSVLRAEPSVLRVRQLREIHEQEAQILRGLAGRKPRATTFISRQSGGKGKHPRTREIGAFVSLMTRHMREGTGKLYYDAVAAMTNAAFSGADVTAEGVRAITVAARRRRAGTLDPK
jgi:hypothetical protein